MKLRIRKQTIRLRLSQPEVEKLGVGEVIEARLIFGPEDAQQFCYSVSVEDTQSVQVHYDAYGLRVSLPTDVARDWAESDLVSLESAYPVDGAAALKILVEKDFRCLRPRDGDEDLNTFPHPREGEVAC